MERMWQRIVVFFGVAIVAIAVLVPLALAQSGPGQVPSKLGSPDPREHSLKIGFDAGLVAKHLGLKNLEFDRLFHRHLAVTQGL